MNGQDYVLVTPARDAAATLELTIDAVVSQTRRPLGWVIVSDGSTDRTDEIAKTCAEHYPFVRYLRRDGEGTRDFGSKVHAINAGLELLAGEDYAYVGNLDADITFGPDYFERLLARFDANPRLGIGGGVTFDFYDGVAHPKHASLDSVGGAVQLFRRACYEDIGGYVPLRLGSEDALALHVARWKGWESRSFPELPVLHHGVTGQAAGNLLRARFRQGVTQGIFGWSPWFVLARAAYRSIERPYVVGALVRTLGYLWGAAGHGDYRVPPDLARFIREEQHRKLWGSVSGGWRPWRVQ